MKTCRIDGCGRKVHATQLCQTHYKRKRTGKTVEAPIRNVHNTGQCSVHGCDRDHHVRGLCIGHYLRMKKSQNMAGFVRPRGDITGRFFDKVSFSESGCWMWTGSKNPNGYGLGYTGKMRPAHRMAYEWLVGEIPAGRELDHLCRNRACVRPDHLEPVTHRENCRRARAVV